MLGVGTVGTGDGQRHFGIMSCDRLERVHQPREVLARLERADRDDRPRPLDAGVAGGSRGGGPSGTATTLSVSNSARACTATCSEIAWIHPPLAATRRTTGPNETTVGEQSSRVVTKEQSLTVTTVCAVGGAIWFVPWITSALGSSCASDGPPRPHDRSAKAAGTTTRFVPAGRS